MAAHFNWSLAGAAATGLLLAVVVAPLAIFDPEGLIGGSIGELLMMALGLAVATCFVGMAMLTLPVLVGRLAARQLPLRLRFPTELALAGLAGLGCALTLTPTFTNGQVQPFFWYSWLLAFPTASLAARGLEMTFGRRRQCAS